jgi:O-antigen biosynthesis protein WbqV
LARDLIALSGLRPDHDVAVKFIGLRPGEKLVEDLFGPGVTPRRSTHDKIWIIDAVDDAAPDFETRITELIAVAREGDLTQTLDLLRKAVPGYVAVDDTVRADGDDGGTAVSPHDVISSELVVSRRNMS